VRIDRVTLADGNVDLATRHVQVGRLAAEGGRIRVVRDAQGAIDLQRIVNPEAVSARKKAGADWKVQAHQLAVSGLAVEVEDQALGLRTELQDVSFRAQDASTDPARPLAFEAGLRLRDGGQFAVKGQAVPAVPSVAADVQVRALPLALAQPVLQRYLHLKLAGGTVSVQGRLEAKGGGNAPVVQFAGDGEVAGLRLLESGDKPFASWRLLAAKGIKASLNGVDIPELRLVGSDASVTIQADRLPPRARPPPSPSRCGSGSCGSRTAS
jgi:hypothetical protein